MSGIVRYCMVQQGSVRCGEELIARGGWSLHELFKVGSAGGRLSGGGWGPHN